MYPIDPRVGHALMNLLLERKSQKAGLKSRRGGRRVGWRSSRFAARIHRCRARSNRKGEESTVEASSGSDNLQTDIKNSARSLNQHRVAFRGLLESLLFKKPHFSLKKSPQSTQNQGSGQIIKRRCQNGGNWCTEGFAKGYY